VRRRHGLAGGVEQDARQQISLFDLQACIPPLHAVGFELPLNLAVAAGSPTGLWRMSGHPAVQQALRNAYFESLGLPRIHVPAQA
jgi:hypothetical protein